MGNRSSRRKTLKDEKMTADETKSDAKCKYSTITEGNFKEEVGLEKPRELNIEIYGGQTDPTTANPWACAKQSVVDLFLEKGNKVMFFDDAQDNTDTVKQLLDKYPDMLDVQQVAIPAPDAGTLVNSAETVIWDHIEKNPEYNVIIFDFDLTLSDKHSSGTTLKASGKEWNSITITSGSKDVPFMNSEDRYNQLVQNLTKLSMTKKLVILSRGGLTDLVNAFSKMGFNVVKAVGMSFRNEGGNTQIVLTSNEPQTLLTEYEKYEKDVDDGGWNFDDSEGDSEGGSEGGGKRKRRNKTHKRKRKRKRKTKRKKKRRKRVKTKRRRR